MRAPVAMPSVPGTRPPNDGGSGARLCGAWCGCSCSGGAPGAGGRSCAGGRPWDRTEADASVAAHESPLTQIPTLHAQVATRSRPLGVVPRTTNPDLSHSRSIPLHPSQRRDAVPRMMAGPVPGCAVRGAVHGADGAEAHESAPTHIPALHTQVTPRSRTSGAEARTTDADPNRSRLTGAGAGAGRPQASPGLPRLVPAEVALHREPLHRPRRGDPGPQPAPPATGSRCRAG